MSMLAAGQCTPCRKDSPPLSRQEIQELLTAIPAWRVITQDGAPQLRRVYRFKNFRQALAFANQVGEQAEAENHHPALLIQWGRVTVSWWTHAINGLHRNDFILAARCDQLYSPKT